GPTAEPIALSATFRALARPGVAVPGDSALLYNFGFFILLAYRPFPVASTAAKMGLEDFAAMGLGYVCFGWGTSVPITSVLAAPLLTQRIGRRGSLIVTLIGLAVLLAVMSFDVESVIGISVGVVSAALLLALRSPVFSESAMGVSAVPRPVASGTYARGRCVV